MKLIIIFIIANIINVVTQTAKSIITIKSNKYIAALANAIAYGLYTWIIVLTVCDLPLWLKILVVGGCNLIGVFVVKLVEEKTAKDKLWKIEVAIPYVGEMQYKRFLENNNISYNVQTIDKYAIFNCYCAQRKTTNKIIEMAKSFKGKYSAYESKIF